jgi:hypothetical protein
MEKLTPGPSKADPGVKELLRSTYTVQSGLHGVAIAIGIQAFEHLGQVQEFGSGSLARSLRKLGFVATFEGPDALPHDV